MNAVGEWIISESLIDLNALSSSHRSTVSETEKLTGGQMRTSEIAAITAISRLQSHEGRRMKRPTSVLTSLGLIAFDQSDIQS
jgi:hypothetical protein